MFALIKWVEDGKFSVLPTEHIRDFDEDEYVAGMEEKDVYLVEWRQDVNEPKGGWPVYEHIIKISRCLFFYLQYNIPLFSFIMP